MREIVLGSSFGSVPREVAETTAPGIGGGDWKEGSAYSEAGTGKGGAEVKTREQCPCLPPSAVGAVKRHGPDRGAVFYMNALTFAQGYWLEGKPAQALLQLNKAFSADLKNKDDVLKKWPWPYDALEWICEAAADGNRGFLGNPVRHFQHLATRMSGERAGIRRWRAWVCFWLARRILEGRGEFPMDGRQIAREGIFIPNEERARKEIGF